jgi:hypothetical protein
MAIRVLRLPDDGRRAVRRPERIPVPDHLYGARQPHFQGRDVLGLADGDAVQLRGCIGGVGRRPGDVLQRRLGRAGNVPEAPGDSAPVTISPDAYKPLPVGSKLTYRDSATCAVADAMTVCVLGDHGFVLKPDGSQAF